MSASLVITRLSCHGLKPSIVILGQNENHDPTDYYEVRRCGKNHHGTTHTHVDHRYPHKSHQREYQHSI